ncbi:glycosyltransferase family 2 protein [Thomasclavelia cocleata]|uniref:glycosyltransferase family 2 protein n=1 Tax=Thomasclavelia cocleata TaxID=69824 RepID=UPI002583C3FD|nr:glycosyltransferase family 2 protein [Thomasclavelia cocleata]
MKFSIIMPVYNAENYVNKGIMSIVNQTYNNWELIIIDDGSNDNTYNVCKKMIFDPRIRLFRINNSGPSYARNYGLDKSDGDYILFLDSDDYFEINALNILKGEIEKNNSELIFFANYTDKYKNNNYIIEKNNSIKEVVYKNNNDLKNDFINLFQYSYIYPVWNKVYSRKIIDKYNVRFPELIKFAEDLVFNMKIYPHIEKAQIIKKALYHYVSRENESITTSFNINRFEQLNTMYNYCITVIKKWCPKAINLFSNNYILEVSVCMNSLFNKDSTLKNKERRTFIKHIVNDKRVRAVIKETSLIGKRNILIGKLIMFHQIDLLYIIVKLSRTSFR